MTDLTTASFQSPVEPAGRKMDVGNVFRLTYRIFRRRLWTFMGLSFLPFFFTTVVLACQGLAAFDPEFARSARVLGGFVRIVQYVVLIVSYGAAIHAASQLLAGATFTLGEALRVGLRRFFPVLGVGILMLMMIAVGTLLLVVPGVIVAFMLSVAVQVCVLEGRGPIESIRRSFALTKGNKWRIFLSYLLTIVLPSIAIYVVAAILAVVIIGGASALSDRASMATLWAGGLVMLVAVPAFLVVGSMAQIILAVLLFELRRVKEGDARREGIAQIFE